MNAENEEPGAMAGLCSSFNSTFSVANWKGVCSVFRENISRLRSEG